jgi:hypothetical protein
MPLRFGPYRMPRFKIGDRLDCQYAGTVRVVAVSDAPQPWPLGVIWGHRISIVCGDLVRAIKSESAGDIAEAWGVSMSPHQVAAGVTSEEHQGAATAAFRRRQGE